MKGDWPALAHTPADVALAAQMACLLEVSAPKPGNVHRQADFPDTGFVDFLLSGAAIGPAFARAPVDGIGQIVLNALTATRRVARTNTNLGIVLLLAPLAKACFGADPAGLRTNVSAVLAGLTVEDARLVYTAIRLARPGGMGQAPQADVAEEPAVTLREAMLLARDRDAVAREYVTDFAITFEIALPALEQAWQQAPEPAAAAVQAYLALLAQVPDTLIARKRGDEVAQEVSRQAGEALARGGMFSEEGRQAVADFDRALRDERHTLNPGTTADLIAAAIFLRLLGAGVPS